MKSESQRRIDSVRGGAVSVKKTVCAAGVAASAPAGEVTMSPTAVPRGQARSVVGATWRAGGAGAPVDMPSLTQACSTRSPGFSPARPASLPESTSATRSPRMAKPR